MPRMTGQYPHVDPETFIKPRLERNKARPAPRRRAPLTVQERKAGIKPRQHVEAIPADGVDEFDELAHAKDANDDLRTENERLLKLLEEKTK